MGHPRYGLGHGNAKPLAADIDYSQPVPFADGLTCALFLTAQYMMSRKLVENWWFWIVGDVLVIGLYIYKHLYLT